jgi:hypothetical protein
MTIPSLKTRIRSATSEEDVLKLLEEGKTYEFASTGTTLRWKLAAQKKLKDLGKAPAVTETAPVMADVSEVVEFRPKRRKKKE